MKTTIYTFTNRKGGVGKTTCAINFGAACAEKGKKVLQMDTDPQGNAATFLGLPPEPGTHNLLATYIKSIQSLLHGNLDSHARTFLRDSGRENLTILPGSADTATTQALLLQEQKDLWLIRRAIQERFQDLFDLVILDTAPSLGGILELAVAAADYVVIPTACETAAVEGAVQSVELLKYLTTEAGWKGKLMGVIPTFYDQRLVERRASLDTLQEYFGESLLPVIHESAAVRELPANQMTIFEKALAEKSNSYAQRSAEEFRSVATEILRRS